MRPTMPASRRMAVRSRCWTWPRIRPACRANCPTRTPSRLITLSPPSIAPITGNGSAATSRPTCPAPPRSIRAWALACWAMRWRRRGGGAGILGELFLAAVAMIAWTQLDPGLGRSLAYTVIVLCGVSTLFMNGNPLLRYDGYYVLSDAIEIPNLGQRSNGYLGYLFKRYALGLRGVEAPRATPGERAWFVGYAVLSFCYRMFIMFLAIFIMAGQFFFFGVLLAMWALFNTIVMPLWRLGRQFYADPQIQAHRFRSYVICGVCVRGVAGLVGAVPMPSSTDTEGVVWVPPTAQVRAPVAGFVRARQAADDAPVGGGAPLMALENDELIRRDAMLAAQVDEYQARYVQAYAQNQVQAAIMRHHAASCWAMC
ncbi:hypothetical protein G6F57_015790 [Rhizopus arrhizus]|nr:hypothetical protein G6F57_015790 [Rhizopus arrhizus]